MSPLTRAATAKMRRRQVSTPQPWLILEPWKNCWDFSCLVMGFPFLGKKIGSLILFLTLF